MTGVVMDYLEFGGASRQAARLAGIEHPFYVKLQFLADFS